MAVRRSARLRSVSSQPEVSSLATPVIRGVQDVTVMGVNVNII